MTSSEGTISDRTRIPPPPGGEEAPISLAEAKSKATELWQRYHASGPGDASEEELVKRYLPLVKTVVGRLAMGLPNGEFIMRPKPTITLA